MKVLHILNQYFPRHRAGTEVYVKNLIQLLSEYQVDSVVLVPSFDHSTPSYYFHDDIEVFTFKEHTKIDRKHLSGRKKPASIEQFLKTIKFINPDILHFHEISGSRGVTKHHLIAAKTEGFNIICTFHLAGYSCSTSTLLYKEKINCNGIMDIEKCTKCSLRFHYGSLSSFLLYPISRFLFHKKLDPRILNNGIGTALAFPFMIENKKRTLQEIYENTDYLVSISDWYFNILILNGIKNEKLKVIKTSIRNNRLLIKNNCVPDDILRIVFVGRITKIKGLHILLKALSKVTSLKWSLDIYGKAHSDDLDYEKELKVNTSTQNNIFWKGELQNSDMLKTLMNYDLLCMPSIVAEMSPMVLHEAVSIGLPVLAARNQGNTELLENGKYGILYDPMDLKNLVSLLSSIIDSPSLLNDKRNINNQDLHLDLFAKEYLSLYNKILS